MRARSNEEFLRELRDRGARRLKKITFRPNRSTIWSLTQDATALNLHVAYRRAPSALLDAFAVIVRGRGRQTVAVKEASRRVREWPGLEPVMDAVRKAHAQRRRAARAERAACDDSSQITYCCSTPRQRAYLKALYEYFNETRFDGLLPRSIPVRLSSRMSSSLGHMIPAYDRVRGRYVVEIALNIDLMLEGNGPERIDTLLHEMAHAADYLFEGNRGHGSTWKMWARRAGCRAESRYERSVVRRRRRRQSVTRVPPLPPALRNRAA